MRIALVYTHALEGGGYPRDALHLASGMTANGARVTLFSRDARAGAAEISSEVEHARVNDLPRLQSRFDIIHIFGIFLPSHAFAALRARGSYHKIVVSPLGHLMPLSMRVRQRQKELYLRLACDKWIRRARGIHVFSAVEREAVLERYPNAETFVASLGVFPAVDQPTPRTKQADGCNLLFFGRNDVYQKGIDFLLDGFAEAVRTEGPPITLSIAGRTFGDSERLIAATIERHRLHQYVKILGPVDDTQRHELLRAADYLTFFSRWDGPPRPIREALALGTPVIVSPETNMGNLADAFKAGQSIPLDPVAIGKAFRTLAARPELRATFAAGARRLGAQLRWVNVARDYLTGYASLLAA